MHPPAHAAVILCALAGAAAAQPATNPVPAPSSNPSIADSADAMPKTPVASNGSFITSVPIDLPPGRRGFTMSLFVAQLAFPPGPLLDTAKLAILVGSAAAMIFGLLFGWLSLRPRA